MSKLTDLISQVAASNPSLADDLRREVGVLSSRRPFGLNFERHLPETVRLPERKVRRGDKVVFRAQRGKPEESLDHRLWTVTGFEGKGERRKARLTSRGDSHDPETTSRLVIDLVVVAEFRDAIFPGLRSTGRVERGADMPYHAAVNGENYHVLEALTFAYKGKVDCIYIDPPYNSGAHDWKYNNDYVDAEDAYRHSKWLAMIERRLKVAKELLNPYSSVLIVTIDEKEYLRLGLLLGQLFPGEKIQMVSATISPRGTNRRNEFSRVDEYIFFVFVGEAQVAEIAGRGEAGEVRWLYLRRTAMSSSRASGRPHQFYPVYINEASHSIEHVGEPLAADADRSTAPSRKGCVTLLPVNPSGIEMTWGLVPESLSKAIEDGFVRVSIGRAAHSPYVISYLSQGASAKVASGEYVVSGLSPDGSKIVTIPGGKASRPTTAWRDTSHDAGAYGTGVLNALLPGRSFPFPKSLYAVEDTLRYFVKNSPDALIVDFFAGSGTTAHAVMRLNRQDGGRRRSVIVTNNEVSAAEQGVLRAKGLRPGDPEWECLGVFEYVTKPRVKAAITGVTPEGDPVSGEYKFTDEFPMSAGFGENAEFFDLTYEDPERVGHGLGFEAIAPLLWLKAGSEGSRIERPCDTFAMADTYAILFGMDSSAGFVKAVRNVQGLRVAYVVTDDATQFQVVAAQLPASVESMRLYSAYLDNFRIVGRG